MFDLQEDYIEFKTVFASNVFRKLFEFLFKFCTTSWILHIWCYLIGYVDGSTASRRYGEERQDDYDDDGPPPSLCETQISGTELLDRQTDKQTNRQTDKQTNEQT